MVAVGAGVVLLTRGGPPHIPAPDLSEQQAAACRDLVADLPDTLVGEPSVAVTGATEYGAAWGDPAIVLTCGVAAVDISAAPRCIDAEGVGWLVSDEDAAGDGDATFTADGLRPRVRLVVPEEYLPERGAAALAELAAPIERHLELEVPCL